MTAPEGPPAPSGAWKVGTLAALTGVTVRALHHYDHQGLLTPSRRTAAGHRLYTQDDVTRLYRISLLRRLGFPLEEIAAVLDDPHWQLGEAVRRHLEDTASRIEAAQRLRARLSGMAEALAGRDSPAPDDLFATLEEMTMLDPAIRSTTALLVYDDLAAAHEYLVRVFGLTAGPVQDDGDGHVVHAEVRAGDQVIWLHPAGDGYRSPRRLGATTAMVVVTVDDADAHHERAAAAGAEVTAPPVDQVYGVREYAARDLEGHLWYFHSPSA